MHSRSRFPFFISSRNEFALRTLSRSAWARARSVNTGDREDTELEDPAAWHREGLGSARAAGPPEGSAASLPTPPVSGSRLLRTPTPLPPTRQPARTTPRPPSPLPCAPPSQRPRPLPPAPLCALAAPQPHPELSGVGSCDTVWIVIYSGKYDSSLVPGHKYTRNQSSKK